MSFYVKNGRLLTVAEILGAKSPQEKWGVKTPVEYDVTGEHALRAMIAGAKRDPKTGICELDGVMVRAAQEIAHVGPVPDAPADRCIVRFVVVSGEPARDNKILEVPGINWRAWDANPVTMWCHNYEEPPIGRGLWRGVYKRGEVYEVWKDIEFMPEDLSPFGHTVGRMYSDGWLRGISGGWKGTRIKPIIQRSTGKVVGGHFLETDWLEDSGCPIPIDRYSLAEAVQRGIINSDQRDVFARSARWPSLSKTVAYEITPKEVLTVAHRAQKPGEARAAITRAIPTAQKRQLVSEAKLHPDRVPLMKPDAGRSEGAGDADETEAGGTSAAGGASAAAATGATAPVPLVKCSVCEVEFENGTAHECPGPVGASAAGGAATDDGGEAEGGDDSSPGAGDDPEQRAVRAARGIVIPDVARGELSKGLDVGYARLKSAFMSLMEPMQELYWVCDSAYYQKRSQPVTDHVPFLAPTLEAMGFTRGSATPVVVTEHAVRFEPGKFRDHRACRAWLADNGFDDNTQIVAARAEHGGGFVSAQRDGAMFDADTLVDVDLGGGVVVTRGQLTPEAAAGYVVEKRAAGPDADEPYSIEMRGDRYLTLLEAGVEAMGEALSSMRDALDAATAELPTAEEQSTIATAAMSALEGVDLNELADGLRAGRVLSAANRKTVMAALDALGKLAAIEEKADKAAARAKGAKAAPAGGGDGARSETTAGDDPVAGEFDDLRSRLGAATTQLGESARAAVAEEVRSMRARLDGAIGDRGKAQKPASGGPVFAKRTEPTPEAGKPAAASSGPQFAKRSATGGLPHVRVPGGPGSPGGLGAQYLGEMRASLARAGVALDNSAGTE